MKVALAFSGGLDTCWCIPILKSQGYEVTTVTVDVGGFSDEELTQIAERSQQLGAANHILIPAAEMFFNEILRYLIAGNVLRGNLYPLCVGAERSLQARETAKIAIQIGAEAVAHGCTAAGNDQVRFEIALRTLAPSLQILAPVRDLAPSRPDQLQLLKENNLDFPANKAAYSVNSGLWGVTIGGEETTGTEFSIPEDQWLRTKEAFSLPNPPETLTITFTQGIPTHLNNQKLNPVELIKQLDSQAAKFGIGRGIHLGETILGIKGRVAFEAPAPTILIQAHRELEKLTLTKRQIALKDQVAASYGEWVHEGLFTDPAARMAEALFDESQKSVNGTVHLTLNPGHAFVTGVTSPNSLHSASRAVYGESVGEWTPEDAKGFSRLYGLAGILHARANQGGTN
ncbi:MAG: argininosuccinate synthase [Fimbriimonadaceae bacterium]